MTIDKRVRPRVGLVVRVNYPDEPDTVDWTENISATGVFIRTERALPIGRTFQLSLNFPNTDEPLRLTAVVVWIRNTGVRGVGIRVDAPQQRKHLADSLLQEVTGQGAAGSYRVFIADDNPQLKDTLRRSLNQMSAVQSGAIELAFFENGHEALAAAAENLPDLVVTDLYMPVMDGLSLIRRLRIHPAGERIGILAMGTNKADEEQLALKAGADGFLPKPFDVGQLLGLVADQLLLTYSNADKAPPEIIIVDDEADNVEVLQRSLHEHRVVSFTDPHKALDAARTLKPKVLLVDYKMPELDGVQLVARLRQAGEGRCAVIMVTAYPELDEVVFARQHQLFYRIIPKPVDVVALREQVTSAIDEYNRKDQSLRRFLELGGKKS